MLATNSAQIAQAAAVPGAIVEPPREIRQGPPEEVYIVGTVFMVIVLFPLSVALARRIWKKSVTAVTTFPREFADRLTRMENASKRHRSKWSGSAKDSAFSPGGAQAAGTHLLERKQGTPERLP